MYVEDIDELDELDSLYDEAVSRLESDPANEQAHWDLEDIENRIEELSGEVSGGEL
ncbi:hypothetical protein SEA_GAUGELDP_72 [Mycobacterium phage GaugeLDP]|nr:hypothetical protein SEA_GAUGELDP_72 [Mycobacterium phage GaugeLDP]